ncbi:hypothetical protein HIM_05027 [Hirsutella minnesotensis 3608]|uniref:RING-type domain-containing protein n=1 Tax=Hirsutella minnesotensis 3608 TaxID=1043627 RepID=A0A0F8A5M0_9HYPO|nr:hypothetical protein HIM_05027 [Hirsutella minnesotensis 3608]
MPRKATRRTKVLSQAITVGHDDILPAHICEYLLALPPGKACEEPPVKRQKVDTALDSSPISIARAHISFSRRCSDLLLQDVKKAVHIQDAGTHLKFGLIRNDRLSMTSRPKSRQGSISATISLKPRDISETAVKILQFNGFTSKHDFPGDIGYVVEMSIECRSSIITVNLSLELLWNQTPSPYLPLRGTADRKISQNLIESFFPIPQHAVDGPAESPMDFYEAAFVPPKDDQDSAFEVPGLEATLFPYQRRTLRWLLAREGVQLSRTGLQVEPLPDDRPAPNVDSFRIVKDSNGGDVFVSDLFQTITRDASFYQTAEKAVKGGILAEEMGLGKTIEILGLVLLHHRIGIPSPGEAAVAEQDLISSRATLIVAPASLRQQWISEIARHAPTLRVLHYQGCKKSQESEIGELARKMAEHDIVVTTYSVLSAELHFTTDPPQRSRRYERAYPRTKSPLVQISWWRLCLDEAQMIENGYSQAAAVARVIPRVNAWGITGTPVKQDVGDLFGLLLFLRYQPHCYATPVWQDLIKHHKRIFQQIFRSIALRHTKALVRDDIQLPPQKRYVISMPFTAVEEQHYQTVFKSMLEACNLDQDGAPITDDWDPEDHEETMRIWLNHLRQTVLHPEVGSYGRHFLGKSRPMRTVDEVLDAMLDQSANSIKNDERAYIMGRLTRGQLYENSPRVKEALHIWESVRDETDKLVATARADLADMHRESGDDDPSAIDAGTGPTETSDSEDDKIREDKGRAAEVRRRLRAALELHHRAVFFSANAVFQIKENQDMTAPESEEYQRLQKLETEGYEKAKSLRREILQESNSKASRHMTKIAQNAQQQTFTEIPELVVKAERGIESGEIADRLDILYGELNEQANVIDEWREEVVQLLLRPLVDEEDDIETTGEEFADSTKFQDLLLVYYQALQAAIADRMDAISGQQNELVKHEVETALRLARQQGGPAPDMMLEMLQRRAELKPKAPISMRGSIGEFRSLQTRMRDDESADSREAIESRIAAEQLKATQAQLTQQNKAAVSLEAEIEVFKAAMNSRLEYYRQLQALSDSVLPYDGPITEDLEARLVRSEGELQRKLAASQAKHRYLQHLKEAGSKSNEPRMCVICQMPFVTGVLTVCGHQFCKECMTLWFKAHHNCPVCKKALKPSNLHDITIKPQQLELRSEALAQEAGQDDGSGRGEGEASSGTAAAIYSQFNNDKLAEIKNIELDGPSFTTKVDTLVRHLMWLRESDPGAKSIVFSQYKDFLNILRNAFRRFHVGHASIDDPLGIQRFKEDPAVEVFLLHARAHSSGLNLVNASHVFLCEPLVNTALELQAIARVDRIGQRSRETTVWLYVVSGTVEESIYRLSVRRRMRHLGSGLRAAPDATSLDEANTLELEQAPLSRLMCKDKTSGEMVDRGDLWECLFGHVARQKASSGCSRDAKSGISPDSSNEFEP